MVHDGVEVRFVDWMPPRYQFQAGGPRPLLLVNRPWWRAASLAARRQGINRLVERLEGVGDLVWLSAAVPGGARLAWMLALPQPWWGWLLEQMG